MSKFLISESISRSTSPCPSGKQPGGNVMFAQLNGDHVRLSENDYFGCTRDGSVYEDLYRLPDGRWLLHIRNMATLAEPSFRAISEHDAIGWIIAFRHILAEPRESSGRT